MSLFNSVFYYSLYHISRCSCMCYVCPSLLIKIMPWFYTDNEEKFNPIIHVQFTVVKRGIKNYILNIQKYQYQTRSLITPFLNGFFSLISGKTFYFIINFLPIKCAQNHWPLEFLMSYLIMKEKRSRGTVAHLSIQL